jgi:hypothetical protein
MDVATARLQDALTLVTRAILTLPEKSEVHARASFAQAALTDALELCREPVRGERR